MPGALNTETNHDGNNNRNIDKGRACGTFLCRPLQKQHEMTKFCIVQRT